MGGTAITPIQEPDRDSQDFLLASAQAVLAVFRGPLEKRRLSAAAIAALRLLESAVEKAGAAGHDSGARDPSQSG